MSIKLITENHLDSISSLLNNSEAERFVISVAYVTVGGVNKIEKMSDKFTIYAGVNNGITTPEALEALLNKGVKVFAVNIETQSKKFHPKLYAAYYKDEVEVIIGSANLTCGGFENNFEASVLFKEKIGSEFEKDLSKMFEGLETISLSVGGQGVIEWMKENGLFKLDDKRFEPTITKIKDLCEKSSIKNNKDETIKIEIELVENVIKNGRVYIDSKKRTFFPNDCFGARETGGNNKNIVTFNANSMKYKSDIIDTKNNSPIVKQIHPRKSFCKFFKEENAKPGDYLIIEKISERVYSLKIKKLL